MKPRLRSRYRSVSRSCQSGEREGSPTEVPLYPGAVQIPLPGLLANCIIPGSLVLRVDIVSLQRLHLPFKLSFDACAGLVAADHMVQVEVADGSFYMQMPWIRRALQRPPVHSLESCSSRIFLLRDYIFLLSHWLYYTLSKYA